MTKVIATSDYARNKDKILKIIDELKLSVILPPEYANSFSWEDLRKDVIEELPKYKDKLSGTIADVIAMLEKPPMFGYVQQIVDVVDKLGTLLEIQKFTLGSLEGSLMFLLNQPYYQQNLPIIVQKIVIILKE